MNECKGASDTSHVFLHTGDIDVRSNPHSAVNSVLKTIDKAMKVFEDCRILVNTLPENVHDKSLRTNIRTINQAIAAKCQETPELSLIDSSNLKLKDSIHFTKDSIKKIACIHYVNI